MEPAVSWSVEGICARASAFDHHWLVSEVDCGEADPPFPGNLPKKATDAMISWDVVFLAQQCWLCAHIYIYSHVCLLLYIYIFIFIRIRPKQTPISDLLNHMWVIFDHWITKDDGLHTYPIDFPSLKTCEIYLARLVHVCGVHCTIIYITGESFVRDGVYVTPFARCLRSNSLMTRCSIKKHFLFLKKLSEILMNSK